jgi:ribosomal protein L16 Arg81 hydroxylase
MTLAFAGASTDAVGNEAAQSPLGFRDAISVQSLIAPTTDEEFRARYWERKPLIIQRGNPGYYGDLFTLEDFDSSITRGPDYVKTAEATAKKNSKHQGATADALEHVLSDMRDGHTLILDSMHNFEPKLKELCRVLAQETGHRFQTNIYLTPPKGKGFTAHWDNHDVFVLQVLGSKHWKVEKERRAFPERDGVIPEGERDFRGEIHEFTLKQGDMVYIPRGFVHAAECGEESSMHITLGVYPTTWSDLLAAAARCAVLRDENLRYALPFGYMKSGDEGMMKRITGDLRNMMEPAFLERVLERFREEYVKKAPLDISGQVKSFFEAAELQLDDRFGVRSGLFYTLRKGEGTVTLNVGTRTITFPDFFGEALAFALAQPAYAIRDLPGELEDEERLVFVERLMQEALIVRR